MFATLDRLDKRILMALDEDASLPFSQIAKKVRVGSDLVEYRVKKYVESGLIGAFSPVIDPHVLGFCVYKTYIKHTLSQRQLAHLLRELKATPALYWLMQCYGRWDLQVSLACQTPIEYQTEYAAVLGSYAASINDMMVCTTIEVSRFPKFYLVGGGTSVINWGASGKRYEIDAVEQQILNQLDQNCRTPVPVIAQRIKSTPTVVSYRMKRLEAAGVICGYRLQFNYGVLGFLVFKVFVRLKDFSATTLRSMFEYAKQEQYITCFIQQIGPVQVELEVEVPDFPTFVKVMDSFTERFHTAIGGTDYVLLKVDHYHRIPQRGVPKDKS